MVKKNSALYIVKQTSMQIVEITQSLLIVHVIDIWGQWEDRFGYIGPPKSIEIFMYLYVV